MKFFSVYIHYSQMPLYENTIFPLFFYFLFLFIYFFLFLYFSTSLLLYSSILIFLYFCIVQLKSEFLHFFIFALLYFCIFSSVIRPSVSLDLLSFRPFVIRSFHLCSLGLVLLGLLYQHRHNQQIHTFFEGRPVS